MYSFGHPLLLLLFIVLSTDRLGSDLRFFLMEGVLGTVRPDATHVVRIFRWVLSQHPRKRKLAACVPGKDARKAVRNVDSETCSWKVSPSASRILELAFAQLFRQFMAPKTQHPKPSALNPKPQTPNPELYHQQSQKVTGCQVSEC